VTEIILRKRAARAGEVGLFSVDDEGAELIGRLKNNRDVGADIIQRRNPRQHRLFFAILQFVKMHCPIWADEPIEEIRYHVKMRCGLVDRHIDMETARVTYREQSMSFAAMDQTKFNAFFQNACDLIAQRWMPPGTTPEDVRRELILMVDGEHALERRSA
jgi:hypothetical protein